jgi:protein-L-isoaspartate(D-aspartate) O-methyltransferase
MTSDSYSIIKYSRGYSLLKPERKMIIPIGTVFQKLKVIDKNHDGSTNVRDEKSVRYVPLTSKTTQSNAY